MKVTTTFFVLVAVLFCSASAQSYNCSENCY